MTERLWEVPSSWEWTVIKELGDIVSGATPSTKVRDYWDGDVIWFAPSDLTGYKQKFIARGAKTLTEEGLANSSARIMPAGSVMFSSRAPVGYVAITSVPAATNQGFKSVVPYTGIFNEYLYHYLKASKNMAEQRATGTTFKELSGAAFGVLPAPLPPLNEQRRIVEKIEAMFDEIDAGIQSLQTARATLGLYRQSLLKSAFEGRLTADWRAQNADKLEAPETLLARIQAERDTRYKAALDTWQDALAQWRADGEQGKKPAKPKRPTTFPDQLKNLGIELPDLPHVWTWAQLGLCSSGPEYGTAAKSADAGAVPVIRMGNLQHGRIDWDNLAFTSDPDEIEKYSLKSGDVLFNRTNSPELVGKTSIYKGERPALFAGYLVRVNQIEEIASGPYLTYFLNSPIASKHGKSVKTDGVNQSNINASKLQEYPFPYCSPAEQAEIVRRLDARLESADALETEIDAALTRADALRQSILKKAFSGQLVAQDPNDEPASALLERIKVERLERSKGSRPKKARTTKRKETANGA
ncbi:restriction endonuclease subunit S [Roseovarius sp. EGI FJ00037]|uniref:restriction endonuclease subunit S n=1 Tax=Roseovarius salincola TaxID=2978479 RepID=UPI0022A85507|nr:restriction endonuclease subunit S [Roseovarius sp. EGI FJ00037]MCZ0814335.1 restriction endonuclease subunit S [Roseovarius sp. EGI FJ00037]